MEHGIGSTRCDFCTRTSEKLIGLQLAISRNDLDDIDEWPNIRAKLKQKFGFGRTSEQLIEDLIDHVKLVKNLDEPAALNIPLAEVANILDSKPAEPVAPLTKDQLEVEVTKVLTTHGKEKYLTADAVTDLIKESGKPTSRTMVQRTDAFTYYCQQKGKTRRPAATLNNNDEALRYLLNDKGEIQTTKGRRMKPASGSRDD